MPGPPPSSHFSHARQRLLAARAQQGDRQALSLLVTSNAALVGHWARQYRSRGVEWEDLLQEGMSGLIRAVAKFNPERGVAFPTYASQWIRQALSRACEQQGAVQHFGYRIPSDVYHATARLRRLEPQTELAAVAEQLQVSPFVAEQAQRIAVQPPAVSSDRPDVLRQLEEYAATPDGEQLLAGDLLRQLCRHLPLGWRPPARLRREARQLSPRALAGPLDRDWWLLLQPDRGPWQLMLLCAGVWLDPAQAVDRLNADAVAVLVDLLDDLEVQLRDQCAYCGERA